MRHALLNCIVATEHRGPMWLKSIAASWQYLQVLLILCTETIKYPLLPAEQWHKSMRYLFEVYLFVWNSDILILLFYFSQKKNPQKTMFVIKRTCPCFMVSWLFLLVFCGCAPPKNRTGISESKIFVLQRQPFSYRLFRCFQNLTCWGRVHWRFWHPVGMADWFHLRSQLW